MHTRRTRVLRDTTRTAQQLVSARQQLLRAGRPRRRAAHQLAARSRAAPLRACSSAQHTPSLCITAHPPPRGVASARSRRRVTAPPRAHRRARVRQRPRPIPQRGQNAASDRPHLRARRRRAARSHARARAAAAAPPHAPPQTRTASRSATTTSGAASAAAPTSGRRTATRSAYLR